MSEPLGSSWSQAFPDGAPDPWAPAADPPAGLAIRVAAAAADGLVLLAAGAGVGVPLALWRELGRPGEDTFSAAAFLAFAITFVVSWLYFALLERGDRQATLGKRAFGLAVVAGDGGRIGFGRASGRHLAKLLSALPLGLGLLLAAFTERKQAAHDLVAGTRVVRRRPANAPAMVVAGVAAVLLGGVAAAGVLAAVAVPSVIRSQLRLRADEARVALAGIHAAEGEHHVVHGEYVSFAVPSRGTPGRERLEWTPQDVGVVYQLGWLVELPETYFTYRVEAGQTEEGLWAYSACAEADLDGDGVFAAWVLWQPALGADGQLAALPPDPPCAQRLVLPRSLEMRVCDSEGVPVRITPDDVL